MAENKDISLKLLKQARYDSVITCPECYSNSREIEHDICLDCWDQIEEKKEPTFSRYMKLSYKNIYY